MPVRQAINDPFMDLKYMATPSLHWFADEPLLSSDAS